MNNMKKAADTTNKKTHTKKHDHSVLGTHSREEKQEYLEALKNNSAPSKTEKNGEVGLSSTEPHVKKHDHSILGKHTKKDKQKYLEELQNQNKE